MTEINPDSNPENPPENIGETPAVREPAPTYVKLAMRNMVRKKGISLKHFFLTTTALVAFFIGVSYLTR